MTTFGRVPHPAYLDHPIQKAEGHGQNNLGQRTVKGVVWHRMIGTLRGTDTYFKLPTTDALTDYGVGVQGPDVTNDDGVIIRWNNPLGVQSGWASGPYKGAWGDGKAFVEYHNNDLKVVNRDQASIEISGQYDTPLTPKSKAAIAALTAYWADQYKISWDKFPMCPEGFSFVRYHQEFCLGTGKVCPGKVVMNETEEIMELVRKILKQHQEDVVPEPKPPIPPQQPDYVKPSPFPKSTGKDEQLNDTTWFAIKRTVVARKSAVPQRAQATQTAPKAAPDLKQGDTCEVIFAIQAKDLLWYWITVDGYRILMSDTKTRVRFAL